MNPVPIYAIIDRRRDGEARIVGEFVDVKTALAAADLLRRAGDPVAVVLVSAIRDELIE